MVNGGDVRLLRHRILRLSIRIRSAWRSLTRLRAEEGGWIPRKPSASSELPAYTSTMPGDVYHTAVEAAREHILAGDIFQVVLAQRFDLDGHHDPFDVYRVLRQVNPSPYMYYVRHPEATLVGSSPEPMVQLLDGRVISRPIAGTRRRGRTEADDRRMAAELSEHTTDPDKFWDAHIALMTRSPSLSEDDLAAVGKDLGLTRESREEAQLAERQIQIVVNDQHVLAMQLVERSELAHRVS